VVFSILLNKLVDFIEGSYLYRVRKTHVRGPVPIFVLICGALCFHFPGHISSLFSPWIVAIVWCCPGRVASPWRSLAFSRGQEHI